VLSIALITIYFRESPNGGLHSVQSAGATVLKPFEIAADRVARPFRDAYGWTAGLIHARAENARLRREVDALRQQSIQNTTAVSDNETLRSLLHYRGSPQFPRGYAAVATDVLARAPGDFQQQVTIGAGRTSGIRVYDPVVTGDGLVGQVTGVFRDEAQVTLLNDERSAVTAVDLKTNADGIVRLGASGMEFARVTKDQQVRKGDTLITLGWHYRGLSSTYPRGIPIGKVTYVGQNSVDLFKQIQIQPFVDTSSLSSVIVLVPKGRR
jgi:rod shape-determining protein MreC